MVNADGIKIIVQLGAADIGQYILSYRYYLFIELGCYSFLSSILAICQKIYLHFLQIGQGLLLVSIGYPMIVCKVFYSDISQGNIQEINMKPMRPHQGRPKLKTIFYKHSTPSGLECNRTVTSMRFSKEINVIRIGRRIITTVEFWHKKTYYHFDFESWSECRP